ncbi:MAG: GTPase family protein [Acidimicrobiales bacterium]
MIGRRRPPDLGARVEALEGALDLADGHLSVEAVVFGRHVVAKVEERLRHSTDHTLVTFLGATGGGKSSLTNAVVGGDVATTGIRRPTTSSTLACYWGDDDPQALLDWLEVVNRHHVTGATDALDGLVLLDVPDHDSVQVTNRLEMERIAEHADLLVWVTDAEKYGDKAMHTYLRRLDRHGAVTALVLNKADQLEPGEIDACRTDLASLLADDGLAGSPVIVTSTATGNGVPDLVRLLADTVAERRAMIDRLSADVGTAADDLLSELGGDDGDRELPRPVGRTLTSELVAASGLEAVTAAVAAGHRRDAASRTGWPFTRWVRSLRPHPLRRLHLGQGSGGRATLPTPSGVQRARTEGAVRTAISSVTGNLQDPWPDLVRQAATPDPRTLDDRVDQAIATSVRAEASSPRWWRAVDVVQLGLAAAVVVGAVWLALLALGAYLQLPDIPTPSWRGIPIPTGLLIGGLALGLVLAAIARRLASVGAARRARAVRHRAEAEVATVADELVLRPLQTELERRRELHRLLATAAGETVRR